MLRITMLLLSLSVLLAPSLAQAQQPATGSIRVQVNGHREIHGDPGTFLNPKPPGEASALNIETRAETRAPLAANGRTQFDELPDGIYLVTVVSGDRTGTTYVRISNGRPVLAELGAAGLPTSRTFTTPPSNFAADAKAAIDACDRAAYDRAVLELSRDEAMLEINLRDLRAMGSAAQSAQRQVESRLASVKAARQQIPPFPQPCGGTAAAALRQRVALQLLISPELAVVFANRPQLALFRLELAGVITRLGAFKPDDTDTGTRIGMSAGMRWNADFLGTKQWGIEAKVWYVDYNYDDAGEVRAEPGGTIGLFSPSTQANPFGGYFTAGPLINGAYSAEVENYGGELQVQTWIRSGDFRAMPWVGVRLGRTTIAENMRFDIGNPAFTSFEQRNDIEDTYVGPTIGVKARVDLSGGLYAFGEAAAGLEYHRGKGDWRTLVPAVDLDGPRKDKLSSSKWGISAGLKAGLGFEAGGFTAQLAAGMSYTNASPYLEYKDADSTTTGTGGADIGYGRQTDYFGEARLGWRF